MVEKVLKIFIGIIGALLGYSILAIIKSFNLITIPRSGWLELAIDLGVSLFFGIILFLLSPSVIKLGKKIIRFIENELQKFPAYDIALGTVGLIVGLIIAFFLSKPLDRLSNPYIGFVASLILFGVFGYLGIKVATRKKDDLSGVMHDFNTKEVNKRKKEDRIQLFSKDTGYKCDYRWKNSRYMQCRFYRRTSYNTRICIRRTSAYS